MSRQNIISLLTLRITLSISAAVVPGAKLDAQTKYGPPAAPRKLMFWLDCIPLLCGGSAPTVSITAMLARLSVVEAAGREKVEGGLVGPRALRGVVLLERGTEAVRC